MRSALARFGKFNLVGCLGAALQLLLMTLLTRHFDLPSTIATPIAVELTVLHNFIWHECFTWRDRADSESSRVWDRLCRLHAANGAVSLLGNMLLMYWLVERCNVPATWSMLAAIGVCAMVNFRLADRWVYARAPRPSGRPI
jgi:putative flippase GtrA